MIQMFGVPDGDEFCAAYSTLSALDRFLCRSRRDSLRALLNMSASPTLGLCQQNLAENYNTLNNSSCQLKAFKNCCPRKRERTPNIFKVCPRYSFFAPFRALSRAKKQNLL